MKTRILQGILAFSLLPALALQAFGQEQAPRTILFYTYAGPYLGAGYNMIKYSTWNDDKNVREDESVNGPHFSGGAAMQIYVNSFAGDFKLGYMYNLNDGNHVIQHMQISAAGKHLWNVNPAISLGTGIGLYLETPPGTSNYDGCAGLQIPFSFVWNSTFDTKLFVDLNFRMGRYGYDLDSGNDTSRKFSLSLETGFLFKVGRL